jgi:Protein of unknown function (DUF3052)
VTTAAGYSGTPLTRKLGMKPGHRVVLDRAPAGWTVPDPPGGVSVSTTRPTDGVPVDVCVAFCREHADIPNAISAFMAAIRPAGALWIAWPRRAAGHHSDITDQAIRDLALPLGLVDTKVAALDVDWSGLRLVWRRELR